MLRLHNSMHKSPWDPKRGLLRSWLKRVTQNAVFDYVDSLRRRQGNGTLPDWIEIIGDNEQLADNLADEEEQRVAQTETEIRVGPKKWQVFWLRVYGGQSADEVAQQLGLSVGTVYNYFGEVSHTLTKEIEKLRAGSGW
jgi:RNA polymerase sigma factor (sigma-70 family)